ncbi:hypothetical protein CERZMDRAFT_93343 [Cercospora zeae-maydis SCOH1-5]|uniref:Uncharacterized protein n=1 Tax=Cercospora zeae-maydis SCOH1-5 TaxID=717836 RepID=A0A6A6FUW2_9PEZI|nr:hypothetical protein CERZMDRAFT_93343 [Cercospora zeae-maydis SCOH1-5]
MATAQRATTLLDLNDDCLFEICRALRAREPHRSGIVVDKQQAAPLPSRHSNASLERANACDTSLRRSSFKASGSATSGIGKQLAKHCARSLQIIRPRSTPVPSFIRPTTGEPKHITDQRPSCARARRLRSKRYSRKADPDVALVFGSILRNMTKLEDLVLDLGIMSGHVFEEYVPKTVPSQLPIKSLPLGDGMGDWMCHLCPRLQASIHEPFSFRMAHQSAGQSKHLLTRELLCPLPSLKRLDLDLYWNVWRLSLLHECAPQVEVLALNPGNVAIHVLSPILPRFPSLNQVMLAQSVNLCIYNRDDISNDIPLTDETLAYTRKQVAQRLFAACKALELVHFVGGSQLTASGKETANEIH